MPVSFPTQLSTVVKNESGGRRFFGYLNSHGMWLDNNESFTEPGHLLLKFAGGRSRMERNGAALARDLQSGALTIQQTPRAIDVAASSVPKAVSINSSDQFAVETLNYSV